MAYRLDKFNGTVLTVLEDGSLDTTTDLRFIGKNYAGYGEVQNENFLHLLENFANNFAPPRPITGQLWFDSSSTSNKLKVYDGTKWKTAGSSTASTTPPSGLAPGDFWFDTENQQLYTWNGTEYVLIGPELTPELTETDVEKSVVKDIFNNNHFILKFKVDNKVIAIISKDEFVLSSVINPIQGFDRIKKGFTLVDTDNNTGITTSDHYYWGTASNSVRFASRPLTDFVLKEEANKFLDEGFTVGDTNDLRVWIENGDSPVIQGQNAVPSLSTLTLRIVSQTGNKDVAIINATSLSPGLTDTFDLGSVASKWAKVYSTDFVGNLLGNSQGSHKGNLLDNSNNVKFNSSTGLFNGNLTGNVTGNVVGNTTGTHKGNIVDASDNIRFNSAQGRFFGDFVGGSLSGTLTGNSIGEHRGNLLSNDGSIRFNASTAFFNGEFSGIFSGSFTGNLNGLSTNVTGVVASQNGGTGFAQFDDGQILIGDGVELKKGTIVGVSPIEVVKTAEGFRIGYVGSITNGTVTEIGITAGAGISVSGSPISSSGNITVTNTGVRRIIAGSNVNISPSGGTGDVTISVSTPAPTLSGVGSIFGGLGLSVDRLSLPQGDQYTIENTGVRGIVAGAGISISATEGGGRGIVTINATGGGGGGGATNLNGLFDVSISSPVAGQVLKYNGSNWTNAADATGSGGGGGGDMVLSASQIVTGLKTFTGGIFSQAYNFTSTGVGTTPIPHTPERIVLPTGTYAYEFVYSRSSAGDYRVDIVDGQNQQTIQRGTLEALEFAIKNTTEYSGEFVFVPGGGGGGSSNNSIFYASNPAKAVQVAVDNTFAHYFYKTRFVVMGSTDGRSGEQGPGGAIVGVDQGDSGGAGVAGVHTNSRPGIGVGVLASAQNSGFTGAVFQGVTTRSKSSSFVGLRLYASAGADPYFVVQGNGNVAFDGVVTGAADYAEYFEWADGNPNNEDRVGMTVSLINEKIKLAESGENIIGVVSAVPAIAGDGHQLEWQGKYLRDDFGRYIYENYFYYEWSDDDGRLQSEPSYGDLTKVPENAVKKETDGFGNPLTRQVYNPHYDATETYIPRSSRPEWAAIGLLGKLRILKGQPISDKWIKLRTINENIEEWLVK